MVTRSIINYQKHKEDIFNIIKEKYSEKKAITFIKHYSNRYDQFNRSYIDWKLAYWLMDDYHYIQKKGTRWFAVVGIGGTGKTTLLKNVLYWLDPQFNMDMLSFDIDKFVKNLGDLPRIKSKRAVMLDEPDDKYHISSKKGIILRRILGKLRQQHLCIGLCATDLNDIPAYMFRKLDAIFFLPRLGKYMLFKNRTKKGSYLIQRIRKEYSIKGYQIFYELQKQSGCLKGSTQVGSPFDLIDNTKYLDEKEADYTKDIKEFLSINKESNNKDEKLSDNRLPIIKKLTEEGRSCSEIGNILGISRQRVQQLRQLTKELTIANANAK
jgi:hypothetical protein